MSYVSAGFTGDQKFLQEDWQPFVNAVAEVDIGIGSEQTYPIPPTMKRGLPVYWSKGPRVAGGDDAYYGTNLVKLIDVTDVATIKKYAGITLDAAAANTTLTLMRAGTVWLPVGLTPSDNLGVGVGEIVVWDIDSTENSSGAQVGEIIPIDEANDAYGAAASDIRLQGYGIVGQALDAGAERTSSGASSVIEQIRVRMTN